MPGNTPTTCSTRTGKQTSSARAGTCSTGPTWRAASRRRASCVWTLPETGSRRRCNCGRPRLPRCGLASRRSTAWRFRARPPRPPHPRRQQAGFSAILLDMSTVDLEQALRVDLAACYRLVALHGWDDLVFTHISARVPGGQGHFLLNPFGMTFEELTASSLVKVDAGCRKILPSPYEVIPAGFVIHSAIHAARDDAHCVLHTHTLAGAAVSAARGGLLPISQQATIVLPSLGYHDYEGLALT